MKEFAISLKNDKLKQYETIAIFYVIINILVFTYIAISTADRDVRINNLVRAGIIFVCIAIDIFLYRVKWTIKRPYLHVAMFLIAVSWFKENSWWVFAICLLISFLFQAAYRSLVVRFNDGSISYPSFPKKTIEWQSLNNVILKDGLLTIDFKNNKLIQQTIDENRTAVNEEVFNDFCRERLKK